MAFLTDPFTQTMDSLWTLLEAQALFTTHVGAGNRIKLQSTTDEDPLRRMNSTTDQPLVLIAPSGGQEDEQNHSFDARMIVQRYEIQVGTGQARTHKKLFPIKWAILKAVLGAKGNLTTASDNPFVRGMAVTSGWQDRYDNAVAGMETATGWVHFLTVEVRMWFTITQLQTVDS